MHGTGEHVLYSYCVHDLVLILSRELLILLCCDKDGISVSLWICD